MKIVRLAPIHLLAAVSVAVSMSLSAPVLAGTLEVSAPTKAEVKASADTCTDCALWSAPSVVSKGYGSAETIHGFGKDVRLSNAAKMIVPDGWKVFAKKGVDGATKVSWVSGKKGQAWTDVLSGALAGSGVQAEVYWASNIVIFSPAPKVTVDETKLKVTPEQVTAARKAYEFKSKSGDSPESTVTKTVTGSGVGAGINLGVTQNQWVVVAGQPISKSISNWAAQAHWTVAWNCQNWVPVATSVIQAKTFEDALTELVHAAGAQGRAIGVKTYSNSIAVFSDLDSSLNKTPAPAETSYLNQ